MGPWLDTAPRALLQALSRSCPQDVSAHLIHFSLPCEDNPACPQSLGGSAVWTINVASPTRKPHHGHTRVRQHRGCRGMGETAGSVWPLGLVPRLHHSQSPAFCHQQSQTATDTDLDVTLDVTNLACPWVTHTAPSVTAAFLSEMTLS